MSSSRTYLQPSRGNIALIAAMGASSLIFMGLIFIGVFFIAQPLGLLPLCGAFLLVFLFSAFITLPFLYAIPLASILLFAWSIGREGGLRISLVSGLILTVWLPLLITNYYPPYAAVVLLIIIIIVFPLFRLISRFTEMEITALMILAFGCAFALSLHAFLFLDCEGGQYLIDILPERTLGRSGF